MPLNILFFVISGAELDLNVLSQPVTLIVGIIYIIARSAGKYCGANLSCRITKEPKSIVDHLGITLLPQAGVALGMAITAASLSDGALARNVVLFAVLVYELVRPTLTEIYHISDQEADLYFRDLWLVVHSLATLIVTGDCPYSDQEIGQILTGFSVSICKSIKEIPGFAAGTFDRDATFRSLVSR